MFIFLHNIIYFVYNFITDFVYYSCLFRFFSFSFFTAEKNQMILCSGTGRGPWDMMALSATLLQPFTTVLGNPFTSESTIGVTRTLVFFHLLFIPSCLTTNNAYTTI